MTANTTNSSLTYSSLYVAFAALMVLLVATVAIAFVPLGSANTWVALAIAVTKTVLVVTIFMGLMRSTGAAKLAALAGVIWLSIAITIVMADYATRGWDETQEHLLKDADHYTRFDRVEFSEDFGNRVKPGN